MADTVVRIKTKGAGKATGDLESISDATRDIEAAMEDSARASGMANKEFEGAARSMGEYARASQEANQATIKANNEVQKQSGLLAGASKFLAAHVAGHFIWKNALKPLVMVLLPTMVSLLKKFGSTLLLTGLRMAVAQRATLAFQRVMAALTPIFQEVGEGIGKAQAKFAAFGRSIMRIVRGFQLFIAATFALVAALGALAAAIALVKLGKLGAQTAPVRNAFNNVSTAVGMTSDSLREDLRIATRETVPEIELMRTSIIALNSGAIKSRSNLIELAKNARILGRTVGLDTTEAFDNMIRGIGLVNPMLLKSVGVVIRADDAYKDYANEIGKTVGALTESEKKHAFAEAAMEAISAAAGRAGTSHTDLATRTQQAAAAMQDFKIGMSEAIATSPQLEEFLTRVRGKFKDMTDEASRADTVVRSLTDAFFLLWNMALEGQGPVEGFVETFIENTPLIQDAIDILTGDFEGMLFPIFALQRETGTLADRFGELRREWEGIDTNMPGTGPAPEQLPMTLERIGFGTRGLGDVGGGLGIAQGAASAAATVENLQSQIFIFGQQLDTMAAQGEEVDALGQKFIGLKNQLELARIEAEFFESAFDDALSEATSNALSLTDDVSEAISAVTMMTEEEAGAIMEITDIAQRASQEAIDEIRTDMESLGVGFDQMMRDLEASSRARIGGKVFERQQLQEIMQVASPLDFMGGGQMATPGGGAMGLGGIRDSIQSIRELQATQQAWQFIISDNREGLENLLRVQGFTTEEVNQIAGAYGVTGDMAGNAAPQVVAAFGSMAQAAIHGSQQMASAVINAINQILQSVDGIGGGLPGAIIGAITGVAGALISRSNRPQPVTVEDISPRAERKLKQPEPRLLSVDIRGREATDEELRALRRDLDRLENKSGSARF